MSLLKDRFAASDRFVKAVGQRMWFADKVRQPQTANEWVRRVAAIANKKPMPCSITPEDVEREAS